MRSSIITNAIIKKKILTNCPLSSYFLEFNSFAHVTSSYFSFYITYISKVSKYIFIHLELPWSAFHL